ncbi:MotA/TolQ/ExbB proton channel family protein [Loktanella agnita]|uniref:MotA/TolQ/ExbB proton channel family protein n=1 Tax=Loktanella agnita TaxID=287097 RepID=UPI0039874762
MWDRLIAPLHNIIETGGPVVATLLVASVISVAVILYKVWQFRAAGVGRHRDVMLALSEWDRGIDKGIHEQLRASKSYLAPVLISGIDVSESDTNVVAARLDADIEVRFLLLERGFRFLDNIAQLAPLLGLFGTVLGMISAFQALQQAGDQVDPSILAGGIWVALLTTAVGLAVAMPTSVILSWLEQRIDADRVIAEKAIRTLLSPAVRHAR